MKVSVCSRLGELSRSIKIMTDVTGATSCLGSLNTKVSRGRMSVEFMLWKIGPKLVFHFIRKHFCLVCKQLMKRAILELF